MTYSRQEPRLPSWPEAVQILARRKMLGQNYIRLVGKLRSQRRAAAEYWLDPSVSTRESVQLGKHELQSLLGSYLRTLAELRGAVDIVFPARKSGAGRRRTLVRR